MRLRVDRLTLLGGDRAITFEPGLNIVAGPITTGKTTLLRLMRVLLGSGVGTFPREVRAHVSSVGGRLTIGTQGFAIVRPLVSTVTARVDIAGPDEAARLPALQRSAGTPSYGDWLLGRLGLPRIDVPSAPTHPDSAPTPVTVNDYMLYCDLAQDEIDGSVFGDRDPFKNIKRKYVFQILYGLYNVEMAGLQEQLREIDRGLAHLQGDTHAFARFLTGTAMDNRAQIAAELEGVRVDLAATESEAVSVSNQSANAEPARGLQQRARELDATIEDVAAQQARESESLSNLERLIGQLETQSARLTRAIVADQFLLDFDFVVCPRCGSPVAEDRGEDVCRLCLQVPIPRLGREDLIKEQDRLDSQIAESRDLVAVHRATLEVLHARRSELDRERVEVGHELNVVLASFVSDSASSISASSLRRGQLLGRARQLEEYSSLFNRLDEAFGSIRDLETRREEMQAEFDAQASRQGTEAEERIRLLEERFAEMLRRLEVPRFSTSPSAAIDRRTFLPVVDGRKFSELSSQGLQVVVNVAHALAHHLTALDLGLPLPGFLIIDGPTSNIGHEGADLELARSVYRVLTELAAERGEDFQIVVADNDVPDFAQPFVRQEFTQRDRLIPADRLAGLPVEPA